MKIDLIPNTGPVVVSDQLDFLFYNEYTEPLLRISEWSLRYHLKLLGYELRKIEE